MIAIRKASFVALMAQLMSTAAWAQTAPAVVEAGSSVSDADNTSIAEIVVTAQKRVERLQDVPLAVNVATSDQLKEAGIQNVEALGTIVPGLNVSQPTGGAFIPSIRGISTVLNTSENPTALYVDGVLMPDQRDGFRDLSDVEQITVLKGPQGTLFGRNATAGVILITTKAPSFTTSGSISASYGSYQTFRTNSYITGGVTETLAASFAVSFARQGKGWGVSQADGADTAKIRHDLNMRGKLLFEPSDSSRVTIIGDYSDREDNGQATPQLPGTTYSTRGFTGVAPLGSIPPAIVPYCTLESRYDRCSDTSEYGRRHGGGLSAQIDRDFGFAKLVSISAYRKARGKYKFDVLQVYPTLATSETTFPSDSLTQEFQLLSPSGGRLQWTLGAFYIHSKQSMAPFRSDIVPGSVFAPVPQAFTSLISRSTEKVDSLAGFAQADLKLTDTTTLTLGGRFTYEKRKLTGSLQVVFAGLNGLTVTQPGTTNNSLTANEPTWRLALTQRISPGMMAYASYNRGFKSGGYNLASPNLAPFHPEKLDDFEIGVKSELFDRALIFNINGFYYKYDNIQVQYFPAGGLGAARPTVGNAAAATLYGIDVDFTARPTRELTLNGGFEILHAQFDRYDNAVLNAPATDGFGGLQQAVGSGAGYRIPLSQKFVGTLSATYKREFTDLVMTLNSTATYSGNYNLDVNYARQKSYVMLNGSITLADPENKMSLRLSVSNALNEAFITRVLSSINYSKATYGAPRTFMATAGFNF